MCSAPIPARRRCSCWTAPQLDRDAGQKLPGIEGLGQIVRRPAPEQVHLVLYPRPGGQDDHRDSRQARQHRLPAQAGKHQVQKDQVGPAALQQEPWRRRTVWRAL